MTTPTPSQRSTAPEAVARMKAPSPVNPRRWLCWLTTRHKVTEGPCRCGMIWTYRFV
jgi:hypothetical protein